MKKITAAQLAFLCVFRGYVSATNVTTFEWTPAHQKKLRKNIRQEDLAEEKGIILSDKSLKQYKPELRMFELRTTKSQSGIYECGRNVCWNSCDKNVIVDPVAYNGTFEISLELTEKEKWALKNLIKR